MPLALVSTNPLTVVTTFEAAAADLDLPGTGLVPGAEAGYISPDGAYRLVSFDHFVPPPGKIPTGGPIQTVDAQFNVTEVSGVMDAPNLAALTPLQFRNLFTPEERLAITQISLTDAQVRIWVDDCLFLGVVDLTSAEVIDGFEYLVAHNIVTQERANAIMTFRLT